MTSFSPHRRRVCYVNTAHGFFSLSPEWTDSPKGMLLLCWSLYLSMRTSVTDDVMLFALLTTHPLFAQTYLIRFLWAKEIGCKIWFEDEWCRKCNTFLNQEDEVLVSSTWVSVALFIQLKWHHTHTHTQKETPGVKAKLISPVIFW